MSGLNQRFTKPSYPNRYREFESHRLRQKQKTRKGVLFLRVSEQTALLTCEIRTTECEIFSRKFPRVGGQTRILRRQNSESRPKSVLAVSPPPPES